MFVLTLRGFLALVGAKFLDLVTAAVGLGFEDLVFRVLACLGSRTTTMKAIRCTVEKSQVLAVIKATWGRGFGWLNRYPR